MSYNFAEFNQKILKTIEHVKSELALLRTGRASVQLLDPVKVEAYGSIMKLNEVANISISDPTLLIVRPWDRSLLANIEKAIASAALNLNPIVNGEIIRVPVPALTQERREEMVKLLGQKIESGKVMLRTVRGEIKHEIESQEGKEDVSEDDIKRDLEVLENKVKEVLAQLDGLFSQKEKELLTI